MRKSQQDVKLDRELRNVVKNPKIKSDIFDGNDSNDDNIEEDLKEKDGESFDLLMANSYSHTIAMTRNY